MSNVVELELKDDDPSDAAAVITVQAGKLHDIASEAEAALAAAGAPFYARGGEIVRPIIEEVAAFHGRRTKVVRLRSVSVDAMRDHFRAPLGSRSTMAAQRSPSPSTRRMTSRETILARDGDWQHFLPLAGVITTPTLRPDGSILSEAGYDPATRLLLVDPPAMPPIPQRPNRDDALIAIAVSGRVCSPNSRSSTTPATPSPCRR